MRFAKWSRPAMVLVFGTGLAFCPYTQEKDGVKIGVDPRIRPEDVHVNYLLVGSFGGYGGFTDGRQPSAGELIVPIQRDGQRAKLIKAVVYAKGCELALVTLTPPPLGPSRARFECRKLSTVRLEGVVIGYPRPSELTVRVGYVAYWSHAFFGITDGAVMSLPIADVVPDKDGRFAVEAPDFANDAVTNSYQGQAEWKITAWRTGTNDQYWLNADNQQARLPGRLPIERRYPKELRFMAKRY